jgi:accessory gene regulator B
LIQTLSRKIAQQLAGILESSDNSAAWYAYSIEILLLLLITMTLVAGLAFLLGTIKNTLIFLAIFAPLRCIGGGVHMSSGNRCIVVSTLVFVVFGYLSTLEIPINFLTDLIITALLMGIYTTIKWVPAGTHKYNITDIKVRYIRKVYMLIALIIYVITAFILMHNGKSAESVALTWGALISLLLITPIGYGIIGVVDHTVDIIGKKRR